MSGAGVNRQKRLAREMACLPAIANRSPLNLMLRNGIEKPGGTR